MSWLFIAVSFSCCCCCFSFCCRGLFVSFTVTIHWKGSSPSYAAGRRLGGFLHHHEMLQDNLWSLHTTVRGAPQAAGFCRSWRFDFLAQNYELLQSNNFLLGCERVMETRAEFHFSWVYTFSAMLSVVNVWLPCPCHVVAPAILQSLIGTLCSPRGCCVVLAVS